MDGGRRFTVVMIGAGMICLTVLYVFLFVSLWAYRQWVGVSLLAVVVYMRGRLNEQQLRRVRYRHHEEIPLDGCGEPYYWPLSRAASPPHTACRMVGLALAFQFA
jgi:hypothetical protein